MKQKYRIWIDQDSVIYDLSTPWYAAHNKDYPDHYLHESHIDSWNTQKICDDIGCSADIYSYFNKPETWSNGGIIENSDLITMNWQDELNVELGVLTTTANAMAATLKMEWLKRNFPHIKDIIIVNGHLKHLIEGDILIDDGLHNLRDWKGIGILFDKPWNRDDNNKLRANNWQEINTLVRKSINLLNDGYRHKHIEYMLYTHQVINLL